jgi:metal-responsive CopG/Arc/MetJ family transcriptional regulator
MKRRIGIRLEEEVYRELKRRAAEERRPMSEVIQTAVTDYLRRPKHRTLPKSGLQRFLAQEPFKLTPEQFKESMEMDFYDQ